MEKDLKAYVDRDILMKFIADLLLEKYLVTEVVRERGCDDIADDTGIRHFIPHYEETIRYVLKTPHGNVEISYKRVNVE